VSEDESRYAVELDDMFVIQPDHPWWSGVPRPDDATMNGGFRYASNTNPQRLTVDELRRLVEGLA
jgi:UDP-N-acetylglucosamine 4,6-dehydratase